MSHRASFRPVSASHLSLALAFAATLVAGACSSGGGNNNQTGNAGSGGGSGSGGSGQGGSTGAGAGLGTGGPFAFPQNKTSGSCMLTTVANAASATQSAYNSWKGTFVVSGDHGLRVQRPENSNDTVSEGIGYGMLAAVYMADQQTFDGLWTYAKAHLDPKGLMNWHISASGTTIDAYSATDGDEDIIFALLMASDQWSGTDYLTPARSMITALRMYSLFTDGTLQNGDNFNTADTLNVDYFSPAYYRVFAKATGDTFWSRYVIDSNYGHLMAQSGANGLVPDSSNLEDATTCGTCKATYGYDACRTPWRIAMDYCFNNETRAHDYLMKIGGFFNSIGGGPGNICDSYNANGAQGNTCNHNLAFIGPAGVSGMAGFPNLLNSAFNLMVTPPQGNNNYFPQSLRVLSMLMMSGNFLDYSQLQ